MVRKRDRLLLHLVVEADGQSGQRLLASFEPHDKYARSEDETWRFRGQGRAVTPKTVKRIIRHALHEGWKAHGPATDPFHLYYWATEPLCDDNVESEPGEVKLAQVAGDQIDRLCFDLSLDPKWRAHLFEAPHLKRFSIPDDYFALTEEARAAGLHFCVFNDGWTDDGFVVFGIESVEFPQLVAYTTNNPDVV